MSMSRPEHVDAYAKGQRQLTRSHEDAAVRRLARQRAAPHLRLHLDAAATVARRELHREAARVPGRRRRGVRAHADEGHHGDHAESAPRDDEQAPVLLRGEGAPPLVDGDDELDVVAVAERHRRRVVLGGDVVAERRRQAQERAASLRAAARRARALAEVVVDVAVGGHGVAAVDGVGAPGLARAEEGLERWVAAVGAVEVARVAVVVGELGVATAAGASQVPAVALHKFIDKPGRRSPVCTTTAGV